MKYPSASRVLLGILIWLGAAAGLSAWWTRSPGTADRAETAVQLAKFVTGHRRQFTFRSDQPLPLHGGDPVFLVEEPGRARQIGEVRRVDSERPADQGGGQQGQVLFYGSAPTIPAGAHLTWHETPDSMQWVLETMLPEEKRRQVREELAAAFEAHHEEVLAALQPVVESALRDALPIVEEELGRSLSRHRDELETLGGRYQREIVERELVPLVKQEIWPSVLRHAEPTATEVGQEIWQRASLWRFGWRYAYDVSPLPEKGLLEKEWKRFLAEEASPILKSHTDDFVRVQQQVLADLARNPRVQAAARRSLGTLMEDPELRRIVWQIVREAVVENPRLQEVFRRHWQSEEARGAFRLAASRMEPAATRVGQILLGTPQQGITPEFAAVLRNRILHKDRRWLVLHLPEPPAPPIASRDVVLPLEPGQADGQNPFVTQAFLTASQP